MRATPLVVVATIIAPLTLATSAPAHAQGFLTDTVRVQTVDNIGLRTFIHRPPTPGRYPVVLVRTPYDAGTQSWLAEALVPAGYLVVVQDVRGTGGSEGPFLPFVSEARDGLGTLEWILTREWSDGRVALWGISYPGYAGFVIAASGHPAVRAIVAINAFADLGQFLAPGGAFHLALHLPWFVVYGQRRDPPPPAAWHGIFRTAPLSQFFRGAETISDLAGKPYPYERVRAPVLHVGGWHDYTNLHTLAAYVRFAQLGLEQRLIVGPWAHNGLLNGWTQVGEEDYGPAARMTLDTVAQWTRDWLDLQLKGSGAIRAPVRLFVMGENKWREFDGWPPSAARPRTMYLADGRLDEQPAEQGQVTFTYDPNDPMPTLGGANSHFFPETGGPREQAPLDGRTDVRRFLSEPFIEGGLLVGPVRAVLYLETDASSADVAVKLVAVRPDGTARNVVDGMKRIDQMNGVTEIVVELEGTALALPAGTRLRLDVSAGNFPKYDRNPHTGEPPFDAATFRPVQMTVHHGGDRPSRLELWTLPPSR